MTLKLSPPVFSVAYCGGYALAFRWNWPLFRYYPVPAPMGMGCGGFDGAARTADGVVWAGSERGGVRRRRDAARGSGRRSHW